MKLAASALVALGATILVGQSIIETEAASPLTKLIRKVDSIKDKAVGKVTDAVIPGGGGASSGPNAPSGESIKTEEKADQGSASAVMKKHLIKGLSEGAKEVATDKTPDILDGAVKKVITNAADKAMNAVDEAEKPKRRKRDTGVETEKKRVKRGISEHFWKLSDKARSMFGGHSQHQHDSTQLQHGHPPHPSVAHGHIQEHGHGHEYEHEHEHGHGHGHEHEHENKYEDDDDDDDDDDEKPGYEHQHRAEHEHEHEHEHGHEHEHSHDHGQIHGHELGQDHHHQQNPELHGIKKVVSSAIDKIDPIIPGHSLEDTLRRKLSGSQSTHQGAHHDAHHGQQGGQQHHGGQYDEYQAEREMEEHERYFDEAERRVDHATGI